MRLPGDKSERDAGKDGTVASARARATELWLDHHYHVEMFFPRNLVRCSWWYSRDRLVRPYRELTEDALRATRRSETAFIFGSGKSLLEISLEEWGKIAEHDTIGFSQFQEQRFVRVDYHLISEAVFVDDYARLFRENPLYRDTVYGVNRGFFAHIGNELVARRMLPAGARIFRVGRRSRGIYAPPSTSFERGLVHGFNSSISTTNFAVLMGWKRIVLAGIDLYDREYFWLPPGASVPGEQPGRTPDMRFPNADRTVETFRRWRPILEAGGVELLVYNPRSLLAEALDVFRWDSS